MYNCNAISSSSSTWQMSTGISRKNFFPLDTLWGGHFGQSRMDIFFSELGLLINKPRAIYSGPQLCQKRVHWCGHLYEPVMEESLDSAVTDKETDIYHFDGA